MADLHENPLGTDGFDFVAYAAPEPQLLIDLFHSLGFRATRKHKTMKVTIFEQGDIKFILNAETEGFGAEFAKAHGPAAIGMGFRVKDAAAALEMALERGATAVPLAEGGFLTTAPVLKGIGGSRLYLIDTYGERDAFQEDYEPIDDPGFEGGDAGLSYIDHLTHNVYRGNMDKWADFYARVFNFRQIRYFDIEGKQSGLHSRAMTSPCGKIRIPVNEDTGDKGQIAEFLDEYKGEGIQHVALGTDDIYASVDAISGAGVTFQDTLETYYKQIEERVPGHGEDVEALRARGILIDGAPTEGQGLLLQIFTHNVIGPIFFEVIQRKGNEGFGEGNFQALFESIELDQIQRGVLPAAE
ncbi:MAG: 4-hydroxyphenylpyruvate dioxygenase [Proteobacteria bacterium]|nr:4-hydroxyphenylpyruvate dioxygenase [Pseudomonadota bacterium]